VVALFIVCALVPMAAVLLLSQLQVERALLDQRLVQLSNLAGEYATKVYERLLLASQLAETLATGRSEAELRNAPRYFKSVAIVRTSGEVRAVVGDAGDESAELSALARKLAPGKATVHVATGAGDVHRIWLLVQASRSDPERLALALEINPGYLWADLDDIPYPSKLCMVDAAYRPLHCTEPMLQPALAVLRANSQRATSGHYTWESGDQTQLSGFRELFLQSRFSAEGWMVVVSQPGEQALGPARAVRGLMVPVGLLGILIATLLSIVQVRRTMGPLHQLTEATKRIAAREFGTRVVIARNDEFGELAQAFNGMSERVGRQFQALDALAQIDAVILREMNIDRIVAILLGRIQEVVSADWHFVLLTDPTDPKVFDIHCADAGLIAGSAQTLEIAAVDAERLLDAPAGQLLTSGETAFLAAAPFANLQAGAFFVLPIALDGRLAGLIALGYRAAPGPGEEEARLARDLADRVAVGLATAARDRQLHRQAHYDALTGLPNRPHLLSLVQREIGRAERQRRALALLFVDLDGFSGVNDALGHSAGDELLVQAAQRLRGAVRNHDLVARLGGDEFTVILTDLRDAGDAAAVARHVIEVLSRPYLVAHTESFISASIGIALFPDDGTTAQDLLRNADMAMYQAKERGRGIHVFFEEPMNREAQLRASLDRELRHAIEAREFMLHYQPQLDLRSDRVVAVEALIRWQHPVRGLVSPAQFIPIAEKLGLIDKIGEWLLGEACTRFMAWQAEGLRLDYISVNVSPRQFRQRNFPDLVAGALRNADMPPERLQLEITESMLIDASGAADSTLALLVRLGVRLAIDDFGTGYSSLSYLKHLPVGTIKLDQSFIRDIAMSEEARAIARSLIAMVQALRKEIVVEGVETPEQLALLNRWGCDVIQGNFLARPLSAAELLQFAKGRAGDKPTSRPATTLAAVGG